MIVLNKILKQVLSLINIGIYNIKSKSQEELRYKQQIEDEKQFNSKWLTDLKFNTILDVGANTGQFALKMRSIFPNAMIYSFEPIPTVFDLLLENFKGDKKFKGFNFGLGNKTEMMSFNLNEFSDSSSLLKMTDVHKTNFPHTNNESSITISVEKLDVVFKDEIISPLLIKLDVQGFEDKVIFGGENIISKADLIITEVSFYELYENQTLFDKIYTDLRKLGFEYIGNYDQLRSPLNNKILQADAIFAKKQ